MRGANAGDSAGEARGERPFVGTRRRASEEASARFGPPPEADPADDSVLSPLIAPIAHVGSCGAAGTFGAARITRPNTAMGESF